MNTISATCAHEACRCPVANYEEYCSEFCRHAAAATDLDIPALDAAGSACGCGHTACTGG